MLLVLMMVVLVLMMVVMMMVVLVVVTMITNTIYWQLGLSWPQQFLTCGRKKVMRPNNWQHTLDNDEDGDDNIKMFKYEKILKKDDMVQLSAVSWQ